MAAPRKMVELAGTIGHVFMIIKCSHCKFGSLFCLQIIFELCAPSPQTVVCQFAVTLAALVCTVSAPLLPLRGLHLI